MDINANTLRGVFTSLSTAFNARFTAVPAQYSLVAMEVNSTTAQNEYPRLDDLPGIREWVGERLLHRLGAETYVIKNKTYEETVTIPRDKIEDDQAGIYYSVAEQIGQHAAEFPDKLVWPLFKNGETSKCYDGQYFFDTDHPGFDKDGAEVSVSNYTSGASTPWYLIDDSQVVKPLVYQKRRPFNFVSYQNENDQSVFLRNEFMWGTSGRANAGYGMWQTAYKSKATLNAANYEAARVAMQSIRRKDGTPIKIKPTKLIVPPNLEGAARALLENERDAAGATNTWRNTAQVVVVQELG